VVIKSDDVAGDNSAEGLDVVQLNPVYEVVPGSVDGGMDTELDVEGELLGLDGIFSAPSLNIDNHARVVVADNNTSGLVDDDGRVVDLVGEANFKGAVSVLAVVSEYLGHERVNLLANGVDFAFGVPSCNGLRQAVDKGVDHRLMEPDLLALLLTCDALEVVGVGKHLFASEQAIEVEDDLLLRVVEFGETRHRHVQGKTLEVENEHVIGLVLEVVVQNVDKAHNNTLAEAKSVTHNLHQLRFDAINDLLPHLLLAHDLDVVDVEVRIDGELPVDLVVGGGDGIQLEGDVGQSEVLKVDLDAKGGLHRGVEVEEEVGSGEHSPDRVRVVDEGHGGVSND